jgi:hypothetical protein
MLWIEIHFLRRATIFKRYNDVSRERAVVHCHNLLAKAGGAKQMDKV